MQSQTITRTCSVEGCDREPRYRGWCTKHYMKWLRTGDATTIRRHRSGTLPERFWPRVLVGPIPEHRQELGPCWLWTGMRTKAGYGQMRFEGVMRYCHRIAVELVYGEAPKELDHLCRVRLCVNPDHLEGVTHQQNMIRSANYIHGKRSA